MEVVIFKILLEGFATFRKVLGPRIVVQSRFHGEDPQILGAALQNLVAPSLLSVTQYSLLRMPESLNSRITAINVAALQNALESVGP
jgi:hypothetical protein